MKKRSPNLNTVTDEELMIAYQNGQDDAFAELYQRHHGKIYGFLRKKLGSSPIADDAFQMTWLKLHQSRRHYDPSFPFLPWLFTICRNASFDLLRMQSRLKKRESLSEEIEDYAAQETSPKEEPQPDLGDLPIKYREALDLRYLQDFSFEEMAKHLETSPANARQRVSRAIKSLKAWFEKKGGEQ